MTEQLHEMLAFVLECEAGLSETKARSLASHFAEIQEFLDAEDITDIRSISGKRLLKFSEEEITRISTLRHSGLLSPDRSVVENFLAAMSRDFTRIQVDMIRQMTLDRLNPNPFLIKTLNLKTPKEIIHMNVYMFATRSIVTSMGFFLEKLLLSSSESVEKPPKGSGWDLLKVGTGGEKHWVQVKSGPNDMDKDQIVYWAKKIEEKVTQGDKAYIGITYGKRTNDTVTFTLMRQHLPDWEIKTLIGKELWDFVSDDPQFHSKLFILMQGAAQKILNQRSIADEIQDCIERIKGEFTTRYGDGNEGIENYIKDIF